MELIVQAALLGLIQGITEFIPISSSAHLELAPWLFGWETDGLIGSLAFDVFLHLGTLLALILTFGRDWLRLLRAMLASLQDRSLGTDPDRRLAWLLVLATIPAVVVGFVYEDAIDAAFHRDADASRMAIAAFLVIGAAVLWLADRYGPRQRELHDVNLPRGLGIGFAQAAALLPGISRSGATMAAGLATGLTRDAAARFSFLLALPVTLGAGLYGSRHLLDTTQTTTEWVALAVGFVTAAVSGVVAIGFLLRWLRHRSMAIFSIERLILAGIVVGLVLSGR